MFDVCIVGGGAAGLMLARSLPRSYKIAVLTKAAPSVSNTALAQGGIAASLHSADSADVHASDTIKATAGHADTGRVEMLTREGASAIRQLMEDGLPYDKTDSGEPLLGMEGAHSVRRILHSGGDQTGKVLMDFLMKETEKRIQTFSHHQVLELLVDDNKCTGLMASDSSGQRKIIHARHTVLATGGIGALYSHTSNSPVAEGDGLSLAYRAGAVLEDLEFIQFHPTVLNIDGTSAGLVSEAVRGEGALLLNDQGHSIMDGFHPLKELAPRDIVSRAIEWHWQREGPVYLDARHIPDFHVKFPAIHQNCRLHGLNPSADLLPVRPGAHFHMGGVKTDDKGATTIKRLYAIGEIASTGVHGANRLASNSLLEAIVFAKRLAGLIAQLPAEAGESDVPAIQQLPSGRSLPAVTLPYPGPKRLKMTQDVGILRNKQQLQDFIRENPLPPDLEVKNVSNEAVAHHHRQTACTLMAMASLYREESRGAHFRTDFPAPSADWQGKTIAISKNGIFTEHREILSKETV